MSQQQYDYAIIGAGAAGLHLVFAMLEEDFFDDKSILILEKDQKSSHDRTWCFWEQGSNKWDDITTKTWDRLQFLTNRANKKSEILPYKYKMIRSGDFYQKGKNVVAKHPHQVQWINDQVKGLEESDDRVLIKGESNDYYARHVFDSRIPQQFFEEEDPYIRVIQHFKGWIIETEEEVFNPDEFVMMDYRLKWDDGTNFTYVLPISSTKALVEFTFFTPYLIEEEGYDKMLKKYLEEQLEVGQYKILEEEKGMIPMSDYPFHNHHTFRISKIGTAGGWVRPSSGYSFKNAERYSREIVKNIKKGKSPHQGIAINRFRKYDTIFLELLESKNEIGEELFETMYMKNNIEQIFRFLDEETSLMEDFRIINSFQSGPFIIAVFKRMRTLILG